MRRIISVIFESDDIIEVVCPHCGKGIIKFKEDNYPNGENLQCEICNGEVSIRTVFTNL
jgi:predicted RNA-binding Zn-ribbon protein involved in translation (DUF1610 family)